MTPAAVITNCIDTGRTAAKYDSAHCASVREFCDRQLSKEGRAESGALRTAGRDDVISTKSMDWG